jgi:hypothetical protein
MRLPASEQYHIEAVETQHTMFSQQSRTKKECLLIMYMEVGYIILGHSTPRAQ